MKPFYKVAVHVDTLDTNPTITTYETEWEAMDAIREEESMLVKLHRGIIKTQEG